MIKTIQTTPYTDQKMGTAGLRKKSKVVMQPNYIENFIQAIFNTIGNVKGRTFVLGGDGRFYNDIAIQQLIKIAAANGIGKLKTIDKQKNNTSAKPQEIRKKIIFRIFE